MDDTAEKITFEPMEETYLPDVLAIYTYYVLHTTATFHAHSLSLEEMRELVFFMDPKYRAYVIKNGEMVIGYAILTQHKKREAYDETAEVTIYLSPGHTKKGIGSRAISYIEKIALQKGLHALVATICGENAASIRLFEKCGYAKCAHYKEVGKKFGEYLDVVAYEKILAAHNGR